MGEIYIFVQKQMSVKFSQDKAVVNFWFTFRPKIHLFDCQFSRTSLKKLLSLKLKKYIQIWAVHITGHINVLAIYMYDTEHLIGKNIRTYNIHGQDNTH
jgi:hypothetical protein